MTVLLHGFWGGPGDWKSVVENLPLFAPVLTPDLYENGKLSPSHELGGHWEENFTHFLDLEAGEEPVDVVGYSMGGRLALNAFLFKPERFRRILLLSTNPCLLDEHEHSAREQWEMGWAEKFRSSDLQSLESEWQRQEVFLADKQKTRRHDGGLGEKLAKSLTNWSIRRHRVTWASLKELPAKVSWAYGALDQKYQKTAKSLQELPVQGQITVVPDAGHRLVFEASDFISDWIQQGSNR